MIKVLKSGFYTTIQDKGRFGYRDYGVPISGCMDSYSSAFANTLLGNDLGAAVLEMTMVGGEFQFLEPTVIAVSGADMSPKLNATPIENHIAVKVNRDDILSFGPANIGLRTYLAIKNGIKATEVLVSQSFYKSVTEFDVITKGQIIDYESYDAVSQKINASVKFQYDVLRHNELEVFKGPEFDKLTDEQKKFLLHTEFKISKNNNRMAYQIETALKNDLQPILTAPVLPGTVQLTPSGNLIVLMRDAQTTGGYPRVFQLTEKSINILSQKSMGNDLKLRLKE